MRNFFFPIKDASIYSELPTRTTGLDEILEVGKTIDGINSIRSLIDFDFPTISSSVALGLIPPNACYDIKLFVANATKIQRNQQIKIHPVSQSWEEGSGYLYQDIVEEVVSASGATSIKDMGRVMKEVLGRLAGQADNQTVSALVKARLSKI